MEILEGKNSLQLAEHKARYGHRDWIWWSDVSTSYAARKTPENVKRMLLTVGTKGDWALISANDGCAMKGYWGMGINILAQMKYGF